ncbi:MAG: 5-(carboxyamino)imidazole ribonucleotide synthase [Pirellula sp.]
MTTTTKSLDKRVIEPGSTLGVFGGGQLGRMFAHAAQQLGYRVVVFTDEIDAPASHVASETIHADYLDPVAVRAFAQKVDCITLEFENVALDAVNRAAEIVPVRPGATLLSVSQHRIREKTTLSEAGFPVTPFREMRSVQEVMPTAEAFGWPLVFKTTTWGYDGKGQRKVSSQMQANDALELLGPEPIIAEKWIPYAAEASVLVARSPRGEIAVYPLMTNTHSHHILDVTTCPPAGELLALQPRAQEIARGVAEALQLEGLLCVEFFITDDGSLMINEIAPRPHNSGHLTIEACQTSQFEQQVRAICNLPLGCTDLIKPAAMANLLGDLWGDDKPDYTAALKEANCHLHLYGKQSARVGRKMGHLTVLADTAEMAAQKATAVRARMKSSQPHLFS